MSWLGKQWTDVKGNAKWDIFKYIVAGLFTALGLTGYAARHWFFSLSLTEQVLCSALVLISTLMFLFAVLYSRERKRPRILIHDSLGNENTPTFLMPRELSIIDTKTSVAGANRLSIIQDVVSGPEGGISLRLKNTGLETLRMCRLRLLMFASFHEELRQFRKPTFHPFYLMTADRLEPNQVSNDKWLVRLRPTPSTLAIPTGDSNYENIQYRGTWKAHLAVTADGLSYEHTIYIKWVPGENPTLVHEKELPFAGS